MYPHHESSIQNLVRHFETDGEVEVVLLGGSIAHGFASPESDVDLILVVSEEAHARRSGERRRAYW